MPEQEINSYRLTSQEEPPDQMLATLMKEVAKEAKSKSEEAHKKFFREFAILFANKKLTGERNMMISKSFPNLTGYASY